MKISTYLTFDGQAREAFSFYQQALGGTLEMMTFAQAPDAEQFPAEHRERIMHVSLKLGDDLLMASDTLPGDTCGGGPYQGITGCSITLSPDSVAEGGQVLMPMEKTFWAERFGMLTDRFGVSWMVNCERP